MLYANKIELSAIADRDSTSRNTYDLSPEMRVTQVAQRDASDPSTVIETATRPNESRALDAPLGGLKKRLFDLVFASAILLLAAPLLLFIAIAIITLSNGPATFSHRRIGFKGRAFSCLKFRSMVVNADQMLADHLATDLDAAAEWTQSQKLRRDPRTTWIGRALRKTSLDELPQLFNVLHGDMSLVGPRPVVEEEFPRYGDRSVAYLSARPGMTGLWQVNGRNTTTYERRTELDATYVANWKLRRDVEIILKTIPEIVMTSRAF